MLKRIILIATSMVLIFLLLVACADSFQESNQSMNDESTESNYTSNHVPNCFVKFKRHG